MRLPGAHSRTVEEGGPPVGTGATVSASSSFHTSVGEQEGASRLAAPAGPLQPRVPAACRPPQSLAGKGVQSPASGATERRDGTVCPPPDCQGGIREAPLPPTVWPSGSLPRRLGRGFSTSAPPGRVTAGEGDSSALYECRNLLCFYTPVMDDQKK